MAWHIKGGRTDNNHPALDFETVPCGDCGERIVPTDAFCMWQGIHVTTQKEDFTGMAVYFHPQCALRSSKTLYWQNLAFLTMATCMGI